MVIYIHGYAHGQAHTFTCTVTHARTFTGMRISARPWRKPIRRDQRPVSTNPQPTPSSKHPEPASQSSKSHANRFQQITRVTVQQISRQPSPANHTYLRVGGAVTSCMYGHARTCTGMRTPSRPWSCVHGHSRARPMSYLHGYAHIFTGMRIPSRHGASQPDETSADGFNRSSSNPTHSKRLGGMGMASLGDAASTATAASMTTTGGPNACVSPA